MGRRTYPTRGPRTDLVANREIRQALRGEAQPSFGIRRWLEEDSAEEVMNVTFAAQEAGDIPDKIELRDSLAVTLLSQKVVSRQLMRGLVIGYTLGKASASIDRSQACAGRYQSTTINRGPVKVSEGRIIYVPVKSERVENEVEVIARALGSVGLRTQSKKRSLEVPHLTLGVAEQGERLSLTEERHVIQTLDELVPETMQAEGWDVYPFDPFTGESSPQD